MIASFLLGEKKDLMEERIGFLINPNIDYICTLWGIWKAGGIAVPLSLSAKENELDHYISDSAIKLIITSDSCQQKENIPDKNNLDVKNLEDLLLEDKSKLPDLSQERKAMILYTSGTTNK
ncbi:uncharacterized protein METZ01_LOCUS86164, partial [marine metagenome]